MLDGVIGDDTVRVVFYTPQLAVTPGQIVAVYDGDLMLGGGWIDRALSEIPASIFA